MEYFFIVLFSSEKSNQLFESLINADSTKDNSKFDILKDGEICCEHLGIDFDEVYKRTNTSYKPTAEGLSDYKSASSVERIEAFIEIGRKDPVEYIDGWEVAKAHVQQVLENHAQ